jgi:hypothetical protein
MAGQRQKESPITVKAIEIVAGALVLIGSLILSVVRAVI